MSFFEHFSPNKENTLTFLFETKTEQTKKIVFSNILNISKIVLGFKKWLNDFLFQLKNLLRPKKKIQTLKM